MDSGKMSKILIINDLKVELKIYSSLFSNEGFEVIKTTDPKEGLVLAQKEKLACILVDNIMSEMDGTEFSRKLKSEPQLKNIPLILLTTSDNTANLINALRAGANDYVLKSTDPKLIVEKVRGLIRFTEIQTEYLELVKTREDFLSIVSHDLKSPIAFVEASMALLIEGYSKDIPKEALEFIERSQRRAHYALDLIHDILELGRTEYERPTLEVFSIKEAITSCLENFEIKIKEKNISLTHNLLSINQDIHSDKNKFLQVINNVLGNAVKFVPLNSQIKMNLFLLEETKSLRLEIEDNGPGIPPEKLEKVFEKYDRGTLKGTQTGTGLGLAICRQVCKILGGNIWAENNPSGGAIFKILLPGLVKAQKTILVCDDSMTVRNYLVAILEKAGYSTLIADSGEKALEIISEHIPSVIVMDMILPGMTGAETVKKIREMSGREKIPVIFQTSYKSDETLDQLTELGQDFIAKPVGEKELLKKVARFFTKDYEQQNFYALILSSNTELTTLGAQTLESQGWNCTYAKNSYEAMFFLKTLRFNLIITDGRNANIEAAEFAQTAAISHPESILYVLSDYSLSEAFLKELGIKNILYTPLDEAKLKLLATAGMCLGGNKALTQESLKILIADDSEDAILLMKTFLKQSNAEIVTVESGDRAFQEFQKSKFDLVIMDQEMPNGDGLLATHRIREWEKKFQLAHTPIWVLTAHTSPKEIKKALDAGCDSHISKPIKKDELLSLLRKLKD